MKGLSFKELVTLFLRSAAKCVTFPNIMILLSIAMALPAPLATDMKQIKDQFSNCLLLASLSKLMTVAIEGDLQ